MRQLCAFDYRYLLNVVETDARLVVGLGSCVILYMKTVCFISFFVYTCRVYCFFNLYCIEVASDFKMKNFLVVAILLLGK